MTFIIGLLLGGISGGLTYALTDDSELGLIVGVIVTVLAWLGVAGILVLDD